MRLIGIASQPLLHDIMVELLAPEQARVSLSCNDAVFGIRKWRQPRLKELVRLPLPLNHDLSEIPTKGFRRHLLGRGEPQPNRSFRIPCELQLNSPSCLGAHV